MKKATGLLCMSLCLSFFASSCGKSKAEKEMATKIQSLQKQINTQYQESKQKDDQLKQTGAQLKQTDAQLKKTGDRLKTFTELRDERATCTANGFYQFCAKIALIDNFHSTLKTVDGHEKIVDGESLLSAMKQGASKTLLESSVIKWTAIEDGISAEISRKTYTITVTIAETEDAQAQIEKSWK